MDLTAALRRRLAVALAVPIAACATTTTTPTDDIEPPGPFTSSGDTAPDEAPCVANLPFAALATPDPPDGSYPICLPHERSDDACVLVLDHADRRLVASEIQHVLDATLLPACEPRVPNDTSAQAPCNERVPRVTGICGPVGDPDSCCVAVGLSSASPNTSVPGRPFHAGTAQATRRTGWT